PAVHEGEQERRRLASTGLGLANHIPAREGLRNEGSLNRCWLVVLSTFQSSKDRGRERDRLEAARRVHKGGSGQTGLLTGLFAINQSACPALGKVMADRLHSDFHS